MNTIIKTAALLLTALTIFGVTRPASAQTNGDLKVCQNYQADPDDIVAACSKFIRTRRTVDGRPAPTGALSSIFYLRANAYLKKAMPDRTIDDCTQGLELNPGNTAHYNLRAMAYAQKGNVERAAADYTTAIEKITNKAALAEVHHNRGLLYFNDNNFPKALADFTQALGYNPKAGNSYIGRAQTYAYLGDAAHADADYKEAARLLPASRETIEDNRTLELSWLGYLGEIQNDNDDGNWKTPPLDYLNGGKPVAKPVALPSGGGSCADAAIHWQSTESIKTRAAYEDHLARFPNCAFAALATARIAALSGGNGKNIAKTCPAGQTLDGDGDCVKARKPAAAPREARQRAPSAPRPSAPASLDCSTPAGLFACANHALSRTPLTGRGTNE